MTDPQLDPLDDTEAPLPEEPARYTTLPEVVEAMRAIAALDTEAERIRQAAQAELDRVTLWRDDLCARLDRHRAWLEQGLAAYLVNTGQRKVRTPAGDVGYVKAHPRVEILDEEAYRAWLRQQRPELQNTMIILTITSRPAKAAIRDHIKATGEVPDGTDLVTPEDKLVVKLATGLVRTDFSVHAATEEEAASE